MATKLTKYDLLIALKVIIDALPDAGALTTIQADLDNPDQYKANVAALALEASITALDTVVDNGFIAGAKEATLNTHDTALTTAKAVIDAIKLILDTPANFMADVAALALEATLGTHDTDIKALLTTVQADLDNPAQYKANVAALALEATLGTHDTDIKALLATIAGYLDTEIAAILAAVDTEVGAIETKLDTPANFMADVTILVDVVNGLAAIKAEVEGLAGAAMRGTENAATVADGWDAALAGILGNFTALLIGYLQELDFDLQAKLIEIDGEVEGLAGAAMRGTEGAALVASGWDAALATILDNFTAGRIGDLDELAAVNIPADVDKILLDTQVRSITSVVQAVTKGGSNHIEIDSGDNGAQILSVIIHGLVGGDWTIDVYVPYVDAVNAPAAGDLKTGWDIVYTDTRVGLFQPTGIAFNMFINFNNTEAADGNRDIYVTVVYRSRDVLALTWT